MAYCTGSISLNSRRKAQLRHVITELEEIYGEELRAHKKHDKAGEDAYADHAAWCVEGIEEALMLIHNRFISEAVGVLQTIVASTPGNLRPWKATQKSSSLPGLCGAGECNHPEHL